MNKLGAANVLIINKGDLHPFIFRNINYLSVIRLQLGITLNDFIILYSLFGRSIGSNPIANSILILQYHKWLLNWGLDGIYYSNNMVLCISIKSSFISTVLNGTNLLALFNLVGDISSITYQYKGYRGINKLSYSTAMTQFKIIIVIKRKLIAL